MGIFRDLNEVEDPIAPPLVMAFALDFVKPRQVLLISRSGHGAKTSSFCLHESDVKYDRSFESKRHIRLIPRKEGCNGL